MSTGCRTFQKEAAVVPGLNFRKTFGTQKRVVSGIYQEGGDLNRGEKLTGTRPCPIVTGVMKSMKACGVAFIEIEE